MRQKKAIANEHDSQVEEERMENDVMDAEGSLHQKPWDVCTTEDSESIDLWWFENTKLNRVGVRDWESLGTSPSRIQQGFCETVVEVMDAEVKKTGFILQKDHEWRNESLYTRHRIAISTYMHFFGPVRILL